MPDELWTTEPVLTEFLDEYAAKGTFLRQAAWEFVAELRGARMTRVIRQTPALWDAGFDLYGRRSDKGYSLTDCMSMVVCRENLIRSVLTHDHHFAQEGFEILL